MADVIALRMENAFLKKIDKLTKDEEADRSTLLRKLIKKGYDELLKEKAARYYQEGKITLSEAAHQAHLTLWEMEQYLVKKGYKSQYSIEDIEREMELLS